MPKIGTIKLHYEGESYRYHEIHYKQGCGFYIKGIPTEFQGITGFCPEYFATEKQLTDDVQAACRKYRELKTFAKRVIIYYCQASTELRMNKESHGSYKGNLPGISDKISSCNYGTPLATFGVDFKVMQVVDDGVKKEYFEVNMDNGTVSGHPFILERKWQSMDFTPERHQFFLDTVEAMKKMVLAASKFFGADPEKAALFIDNKQSFLMLGQNIQ